MSELNASNLRKEQGNEGPDLVGTTELTSPYFMVPPSGNTDERPQNPQPGTLRFNTDIGSLEYFKGDTIGWESIDKVSPNLGGGTGSNTGKGHRGLYGSGQKAPSQGTYATEIDFLTISTLGNAQDFGDLATNRSGRGLLSSATRAVFGCGYGPADDMEYVTIASTGDALTFGLELGDADGRSGLSDGVRGIFAGIITGGDDNVISYITIASTGNAVDFGDQTTAMKRSATFASSTRGIIAGGSSGDTEYNIIEYLTIRTLGNSIDFGDLTHDDTNSIAGGSNATRGVVYGGTDAPGYANVNNIEYLTIATLGNSIDFGDTSVTTNGGGGCPDPTRLVMKFGAQDNGTTLTNVIEYVQISTTGNSVDFGDSVLQTYSVSNGTASTGHGGL